MSLIENSKIKIKQHVRFCLLNFKDQMSRQVFL